MDAAMNPSNPQTWDDLANHQAFEGGRFDPNWYDGDVKEDLLRLRNATTAILNSFPTWSCALVVLDDCTMYVRLVDGNSTVGSLYPAITDDFKQCYFLDIEECPTEIRATTPTELINILRDVRKQSGDREKTKGSG